MIGINQLTKTNYSLIGVDFTAIILFVQIPLPDCRIGETGNTSYLKSLSPIECCPMICLQLRGYILQPDNGDMYKFVLRYHHMSQYASMAAHMNQRKYGKNRFNL